MKSNIQPPWQKWLHNGGISLKSIAFAEPYLFHFQKARRRLVDSRRLADHTSQRWINFGLVDAHLVLVDA